MATQAALVGPLPCVDAEVLLEGVLASEGATTVRAGRGGRHHRLPHNTSPTRSRPPPRLQHRTLISSASTLHLTPTTTTTTNTTTTITTTSHAFQPESEQANLGSLHYSDHTRYIRTSAPHHSPPPPPNPGGHLHPPTPRPHPPATTHTPRPPDHSATDKRWNVTPPRDTQDTHPPGPLIARPRRRPYEEEEERESERVTTHPHSLHSPYLEWPLSRLSLAFPPLFPSTQTPQTSNTEYKSLLNIKTEIRTVLPFVGLAGTQGDAPCHEWAGRRRALIHYVHYKTYTSTLTQRQLDRYVMTAGVLAGPERQGAAGLSVVVLAAGV
ncbi:hypothetical protein E2C01_012409 [Portunus trituberculatus]|uniref:Uncharacterized protein n=1 Tax=Portunus trituberculatus TaxID=210409 RepID=A0A5B7DDZ7_PORTR|nr:hypothetical protein [Portunus trituberculatus]